MYVAEKETSLSHETPLLSVLTGTRNRPEILSDMVRSVLEHTKHPFELLIGDASDGSPFECGDPRVRVLQESTPLGPVRGFNKLFRQAQGDLVCWLNDDLEVLPCWSDAVVGVFESYPEVDLVCLPLMEPEDPDPFILLYKQIPYAQMGVIRRDVGDSLGWFDERYQNYGPDIDFTMRFIDSDRRMAPVYGRVLRHHKIEDGNREVMMERAKSDNAKVGRILKPRRYEIRAKFRRTSYHYFSNLGLRYSDSYGCDMLDIPLAPDGNQAPPERPYQVTIPRFQYWLERRFRSLY